ncbi:6096_t:CDS:1, partial [Ambispora gerdemannii]
SIKTSPTCPRPDCKKEVESTADIMLGSQNISDLMDISRFDDVKKQIPEERTDIALRKRMERARKIYKLSPL